MRTIWAIAILAGLTAGAVFAAMAQTETPPQPGPDAATQPQMPSEEPTEAQSPAPEGAPTEAQMPAPADAPTEAQTPAPTDEPMEAQTPAPADTPTEAEAPAPADAPAEVRTPTPTPTQTQRIDCPPDAIVDAPMANVPEGWFASFGVYVPLSGTRVVPLDEEGRVYLNCSYQSARAGSPDGEVLRGAFVRQAPAGHTCAADAAGFTCVLRASGITMAGGEAPEQTAAAEGAPPRSTFRNSNGGIVVRPGIVIWPRDE